ncbi:hypothetical protein AGMMS50293_28740 [Spirochaetia bacterium]|nr:hypothetical protein AGMMS50293_28740 [Spirochaetia bacterium]
MKTLCKPTFTLIVLSLLVLGACNQDPIFYTISRGVALKDPRIPGGPANFTVFNRDYSISGGSSSLSVLYAAAGKKIHWYAKPADDNSGVPGWDRADIAIEQPGGRIKYLAATDDYLYAISFPNENSLSSVLKRIGKSETSWTQLGFSDTAETHRVLQTIYAAKGILFIGAEREGYNTFNIFYVDETDPTNTMKRLTIDTPPYSIRELNGAAFDGENYFLSINSSDIYQVPGTYFSSAPKPEIKILSAGQVEFMNIISLENAIPPTLHKIVAIDRGGKLYEMKYAPGTTDVTIEPVKDGINEVSMGTYATGALSLWRDPTEATAGNPSPAPKLLLAGKQDSFSSSSYANGYREFEIIADSLRVPREPGTYPSSVDNNERYKSTIGKLSVTHIFQVPYSVDPEMILFASTQKNGLWSYRIRDNTPQWNAEE